MGLFDYSSSPLSSILPQSSPYQLPDYANAFKTTWQPQLNSLQFRTGLTLSGSSNFATALNGKTLMNDAMNQNNNSQLYSTSSTDNQQNTTNQTINTGLQILGQTGEQVGGTAGQIMQGASKVGTSIKNLTDASKAAGGFKNLSGAGKAGGIGAIAGAASDMIGSFMPEKTEYSGDKGDITQTMDSVYDGISDAAMSFGPVGMMVGGIMKGGALLGKGMNALGGGTDGMTTTDAILGSSFLNLTPLGLVNGFGGKTTDTITKDDEAFEQVGSSYTGSNSTIDAAVHKSGKKYGLLSSGARKEANAEIAEAKRQQSIISNISEDVQDRMTLKSSMSAINGNRRNFLMQGGYDQTAVRVGRHGMSLELLEKARSIIKAQQGTKVLDPFQVYLQSLPENQRDSTNYRVRDYWEYNGKPKNFDEAVQKGMFNKLSDGWHSRSIAENPNTGEIEYMKSENHPTRHMESDWYEKGLIYNDDGTTTQLAPGVEGYEEWKDFTNNYELQKTSPYWKYVRRKAPIKQEIPQHRNGGSVIKLISETTIDLVNPATILEFKNGGSVIELTKESIIELIDPATILEFKNGGSVNIIPDGALHARKHNMEDSDNLTKKGIPVVDNKGEQQAEIERNEIIFRLEVTQKLEELEKKYYDKDSSQKEKDECALEAGELLVKEILHNTDDKTGLIDTLKQGGVLKISE